MQLTPGADTVGLAALARQLIDIALDEGGSPEGHLQGIFQVLQEAAQGLAQAAEAGKLSSLHSIILYRIQIYASQVKNRYPYEKMFLRINGRTPPTGFPKGDLLLSELQDAIGISIPGTPYLTLDP